MEFAGQARSQLLPLIVRVRELAAADAAAQRAAVATERSASDGADRALEAFFANVLHQAQAMQAEEDVLALFFELSATAFLGFEYSPKVARAIDELLATAEQIAFTMTASEHNPH